MKVRIPKTKNEYTLEEIIESFIKEVIKDYNDKGRGNIKAIDILPWLLCESSIKLFEKKLQQLEGKKKSFVLEKKTIIEDTIKKMIRKNITSILENYVNKHNGGNENNNIGIFERIKNNDETFLTIKCIISREENEQEIKKIQDIVEDIIADILDEKIDKHYEKFYQEVKAHTNNFDYLLGDSQKYSSQKGIRKEFPKFTTLDNFFMFSKIQDKVQNNLTNNNDELNAIERTEKNNNLSRIEKRILEERKKVLLNERDR